MCRNIAISLSHTLLLLLILGSLGATAQLLYLPHPRLRSPARDSAPVPAAYQKPITMGTEPGGDEGAVPMLSDVISIDRAISIFSGLTRSVEGVETRLEDAGQNTTVLAPGNTFIQQLPRKPWEDPDDEELARTQGIDSAELYRGDSGEDRAARNLRRFVEAHLIGISPWNKGKENEIKTLEGKSVWWDDDGSVRKVKPTQLIRATLNVVLT